MKTTNKLFIYWFLVCFIIQLQFAAQSAGPKYSTKIVQVNNEKFPLIDHGSGPAILLLHGFPDSKELWNFQVSALAKAGYRVVAPDLRGAGDAPSPLEKERYAMPLLMNDAIGILDALALQKVHLVGHDWGAALAWQQL